ncbi:MAG TPA: peptidoglycan binding domain-containing protein [Anaerolineae bacterium]|nr:peptidoglycan binding domain-containing protein [Anaerolineae bacterium]
MTMHEMTPSRREDLLLGGLILFLTLILIGTSFFCGWVFLQRMERLYQGHIYPNVYALGVALGGMTPAEAVAALDPVAAQVSTGELVLTDGDRGWSYDWAEAGMSVDATATVQAAYAVGRGPGWREQLSVWLDYHDVWPRFTFDAVTARGLLETLSQKISVPPVEPTLKLENGEIIIVPGMVGRVLDVSSTLAQLQAVGGDLYRVELPLVFADVAPADPDAVNIKAQVEPLLGRSITMMAYDVLTEETLTWTFDREDIAQWLYLAPGPDGRSLVDINKYAIQTTLVTLAAEMGDGRGFRFDEAAQQILDVFDAGGGSLHIYLTHPERVHQVRSGDTVMKLGDQYGMPPGLIVAANPAINPDQLSVGQPITIPSQDILLPNMPIIGKKIVVSLAEQRTRVYENGALLYDWIVSTGLPDSPTHRGTFQVLGKHDNAYASQWDLWMPYFISVYPAGGGVENGFHELPILANGQRLWAGSLGHPASFGCIILGIPDAETLYNWAEVGVTVVIE